MGRQRQADWQGIGGQAGKFTGVPMGRILAKVHFGNTALSIMTLSIMTLSIMTLSIMTLSIMMLSIMMLSIMMLSIMTLSIMMLSIMTFNIMTLSIMTISISGLFLTLSITRLFIKCHTFYCCDERCYAEHFLLSVVMPYKVAPKY